MVWPTGATRVAGVIGDPVRHSLSPVLHNAAFSALGLDWAYLAFPVPAASTQFRYALLGGDAGFIGAAACARQLYQAGGLQAPGERHP